MATQEQALEHPPPAGRGGTRPAAAARAVLCAAVWALASTGVGAAEPPRSPAHFDPQPAAQALDALRHAWVDELDGLTAAVRALAVADDTYDFVVHPNFPYVYAHYERDRLAAARIDTLLLVNRKGKPLLWRRPNDPGTRGFPDAERFLAELPALAPNGASGVPSLAGALRLRQGDALVVAMPIHPASGAGEPRGWVIAARALDAQQWQRYQQLAHVAADVLAPVATATADGRAAPVKPLATVVREEANGVRGLMAVPDVAGRPLRVFSVLLPKPPAAAAAPAAAPRPSGLWLGLGAAIVLAAGVALALVSRRRPAGAPARKAAAPAAPPPPARPAVTPVRAAPAPVPVALAPEPVPPLSVAPAPAPTDAPDLDVLFGATGEVVLPAAVSAPAAPSVAPLAPPADVDLDVSFDDAEALDPPAPVAAPAPTAPAAPAPLRADAPLPDVPAPTEPADAAAADRERLRASLASLDPVFLFQPQIDIETGQVTGAEALLSVPEWGADRPATEFVAWLEDAGLGYALAERWLHAACKERRYWWRHVGKDFPIGVPVAQGTLESPAFLALLRDLLAQYELPAALLELEVPEAAFVGSAAVRRVLGEAHALGVSIALDGFTGEQSTLRALLEVPIAKLRMAPALIQALGAQAPQARLFDAIVGAARGLGIPVCATGVDSLDLVAAAEQHGCPLLQGTALGPAVDGERVLELLRGTGRDTASLPTLSLEDVVPPHQEAG